MKGRRVLSRLWVVGLAMVLLLTPVVVGASEVDVAVVDVTEPIGSITLAPGESGVITINMTVTGRQGGESTFKVYRDWILSGGTFVGSNEQEFVVPARDPRDAPTTFSTTGTVTVAAGQADGTFTLAVGAFGITNSAQQAKLEAGQSSNYQVIVQAPSQPVDTTPPLITPNVSGTPGNNDWYVSDVTVSWSVVDEESEITSTTGCDLITIDYDTAGATLTCSATSGGGTASASITIKRDATAPTIAGNATPEPNANGWNDSDVVVSFTCNDNLSGVASCGPDQTLSDEGAGQSVTGTAVDNAGNSAQATVSGINIDKTPPSVDLVGGPEDGASYYFGFVPAEPSCSASDALSGLDGACSVSGYGTAVGSHTVTARATDLAGNAAIVSRSYTVLAWTLKGFYKPVDMGADVINTVKGGSTVPLKFEIFAGPTELTETAMVKSLTAQAASCSGGAQEEPVEATATGGTSLRYDWSAGQFVYNWQTPKKPGTCHQLRMTTQDGSALVAYFKLK